MRDLLRLSTFEATEPTSPNENVEVADERARFALDASGVGIWEASLRTQVTYWSSTCERLHGLKPGTFGNTFDAFLGCVHKDDRSEITASIERAVRERRDAKLEYRTVWPDGTLRRISSVGRFFFDDTGVPTRGAGVVVDITEQRSLEEQLRQSQKMEAVGRLAGGVAHDFNNILTVIQAHADFVVNACDATDDRRFDAIEIKKAANRAAALTRQLLAFSRKQLLKPTIVDLNDVVEHVRPMLERLIGEDIEIAVRSGRMLGQVLVDPGQMEQVIINLVLNARDAMPRGGMVSIATTNVVLDERAAADRPGLKPGPYVRLSVSDAGVGMSAAVQARIFEPFFTTKEPGQGTGLGLSTVHGIITQSGGTITVDSAEGIGTTFELLFPHARPLVPTGAVHSGSIGHRPAVAGGNETILLVEDDTSVRNLAARVLKHYGYNVLTATNGRDALAQADRHAGPIHLVFTDAVMPEMGGAELIRELQHESRRPGIKVLVTSGYTEDDRLRRDIVTGISTLLPKPFTNDQLASAIRSALDSETAISTSNV